MAEIAPVIQIDTGAAAGRPMLILPEALTALPTGAELSRFVGSRRGSRGELLPYRRTADGTAILSILGPLSNREGWLGQSYESIQYQLAAAGADPEVTAIVLDIESPGGQASGAFEAAASVRNLAAAKPVVAVVNGMAASAAYAIASGASRIVTTPSGLSGSIGVVLVHTDYSRMLDQAGITATILHAGARKTDGNPLEPLSADGRAALQAEIDALYAQFVATVAAGRKGLSAQAIRDQEARVYLGAEAVAAGLADEVGSFDAAVEMLPRLRARTTIGRARMTTERPLPDAAASQSEWVVGAAEDLPIDKREAWDGPAAAQRMLDAAGFDGASPDPAKARRGFLAYDASNPKLKGSYKLPFADLIGGELKAVSGGLRAAASRLPDTDIPAEARTRARAVIDTYERRLAAAEGGASERSATAMTELTQADLDRARSDGAKSARERVAAIVGLDEAKGREAAARHLALTTELTPEQAKAVLAGLPKASSLEERAAGVPKLGAEPGTAPDRQAAIDKGWADIAAGLNRDSAQKPGFRARTA